MNLQLFPRKYGNLPLLWSIYLSFPLIYFLGMGGLEGSIGLLGLFIFIYLYRDIYWHPSRAVFHIIIMTGILAWMIYYYHEGLLYTALYTANMLGFVRKRLHFSLLYVLQLGLIGEIFLLDRLAIREIGFSYIFAAVIMLVVIPLLTRYEIKWANTKKELDRANERIEELVKQQERERIARDLHDTVGQTLSMITLKSDIAGRMLHKNVEKTEQEIKEINHISRTVLNQIREIVSDLKQLNLEEELNVSNKLLRQAGIEAYVETPEQMGGLNQLYENILAYSLRECVTNAIRHSGATQCFITLKEQPEQITLQVLDNGVGFSGRKGNGLLGMEERIHMISGAVSMKNIDKLGCQIGIQVPKVQKSEDTAS